MIDAAEAAILERIFRAYAAGASPKRIALRLNAEAVPAPRGGAWSASTLNGNRARGTGILNNELYVGRLCWNRLAYVKDPETGRRRSRQRAREDQIFIAVPELRIIDQDLWEAVKQRQCALGGPRSTVEERRSAPFWSKQRPRYLFSGLMRCGVCDGGFSKISAHHFGCSTARNKGPTACMNGRTIRCDELEDTVLSALRERLMEPELFKVFAEEFTAEWNRLQGQASAEQAARAGEVHRVRQQINRLVDAITEGTPAAAVRERLATLEQRRLALEMEAATAVAPAPRLHPNLAEVYRRKMAELTEALRQEDSAEARELVRSLVDYITLIPEGISSGSRFAGSWLQSCAWHKGLDTQEAPTTALMLWLCKSRWLRGHATTYVEHGLRSGRWSLLWQLGFSREDPRPGGLVVFEGTWSRKSLVCATSWKAASAERLGVYGSMRGSSTPGAATISGPNAMTAR